MYSCEQDHTAAARTTTFDTSYQACAAARSLQLHAHHPGGQQVLLRAAAGSGSVAAAAVQPPRRARSSKKHAASSRQSSSSSRRSSTTVVATDVNNFRAMVQELTGFPPAAIFRPLPRRVHAATPFVAVAAAAGQGQGCGGGEQHGATNSSTAAGGGGSSSSSSSPGNGPAVAPVMAQQPQFAPLGVFDGLSDLGPPEFDSWGDLSID